MDQREVTSTARVLIVIVVARFGILFFEEVGTVPAGKTLPQVDSLASDQR